ncbi:MAG: hypothetical protein CL823_05665 [Crocinitomicaceae bacterium]|nr:hypothetical protein [Crocinitomicaceae bacterium]
MRITATSVLILFLSSFSYCQTISDYEIKIDVLNILSDYSDMSLDDVMRGKSGKGGGDSDYYNFLDLFTEDALIINDILPYNDMGSMLRVNTLDSKVGVINGNSPDYIDYLSAVYSLPPDFDLNPYFIEFNSDKEIICYAVKSISNAGILANLNENNMEMSEYLPHSGFHYDVKITLISNDGEMLISKIELHPSEQQVYAHLLNINVDGYNKINADKLYVHENIIENWGDSKSKFLYLTNSKAISVSYNIPDLCDKTYNTVQKLNIEDFRNNTSNNRYPAEQKIEFYPQLNRISLVGYKSRSHDLFDLENDESKFKVDSKVAEIAYKREKSLARGNYRLSLKAFFKITESEFDVQIDTASSVYSSVDPDDFEYIRYVTLNDYKEEFDITSLGIGGGVAIGKELEKATIWLNLQHSFSKSTNEITMSNSANVYREGLYEDLYGIIIDENHIYDFGSSSISNSYNLNEVGVSNTSLQFIVEHPFSKNFLGSVYGGVDYSTFRFNESMLNTDYWYDSDSPYSVFSSKNSVNIYSLRIGLGLTYWFSNCD